MTDANVSTSAARLWRLVEERARHDADVEALDRQIWDLFGEEAAVLWTDLSGFSRQVAKFGIVHFLQIIFEKQKLLLPVIEHHDGVLIKIEADSFLVVFRKPERALACAIAMQKSCQAVNARRQPEDQIILCCGIGAGKVLRIGDEDVFGHEVNLASKLGEDTARGDEILVPHAARVAIGELPGVRWENVEREVAGQSSYWQAHY